MGIVGGGAARGIELPRGWTLGSCAIFFEGEDLSADPEPFAANIVVQARTDYAAGTPIADVVAADWRVLEAGPPSSKLVQKGEVSLGGVTVMQLELIREEGEGQKMQQLLLYGPGSGGRIYAVVGTHVAGQRFARIRPRILDFAQSIFSSVLG